MKFRISKRADADIDGIWEYIARDSTVAANRVEDELHAAIHFLAEFPGIGHSHIDVPDTRYRFWKVFNYLIAYRVEGSMLVVVRVLHGARDLRRLFKRRP